MHHSYVTLLYILVMQLCYTSLLCNNVIIRNNSYYVNRFFVNDSQFFLITNSIIIIIMYYYQYCYVYQKYVYLNSLINDFTLIGYHLFCLCLAMQHNMNQKVILYVIRFIYIKIYKEQI